MFFKNGYIYVIRIFFNRIIKYFFINLWPRSVPIE